MSLQQLEARMGQIEARLEGLSERPRTPAPLPASIPAKMSGLPGLPSFGATLESKMPFSIQPGQTIDGLTIRPINGGGMGADINEIVARCSPEFGLDPKLVHAVIKAESDGNPMERSNKGAMGLMQLMPDEVKAYGITNPFDPEQNIRGGMRQLRDKLKLYNGDVKLALAAYNAGTGAVRKHHGVPPFPETHNYINKISKILGRPL